VKGSIAWEASEGLSCLNCLNPVARPRATETFRVRLLTDGGCEVTEEITITVDERREVFVPSAFSPNGDGVNDVFFVPNQSTLRVESLSVFDRWGAEVHRGSDVAPGGIDHAWDGRFRTADLPPGVYAYVIDIEFVGGEKERIFGEVLLLR